MSGLVFVHSFLKFSNFLFTFLFSPLSCSNYLFKFLAGKIIYLKKSGREQPITHALYFFATTATTTNNDDSGVANLLVMQKRHYHWEDKDDDGGVGGLLVMRKQNASNSPLTRMQRGGGPGTLDGLFSDGGTGWWPFLRRRGGHERVQRRRDYCLGG